MQKAGENDRIKTELKFFGKTVKGLSREEFEEALYRALAGEYTREEQSRPQSVVWSIPEAEFAEILENSPVLEKGKPIRLLSCEAGKEITKPPAQYLADHLQVRIMAPTDTLYIYPDGKMKAGRDNDGYWRIFEPQEKKER